MTCTSTLSKTTHSGLTYGNTLASFHLLLRIRYVVVARSHVLEGQLIFTCRQNRILEPGLIPEIPAWFPGAKLNYAENLLTRKDDGIALTEATESGRIVNVTFRELNERVRAMAAALRVAGLQVGDRVAGALSPPRVLVGPENTDEFFQLS